MDNRACQTKVVASTKSRLTRRWNWKNRWISTMTTMGDLNNVAQKNHAWHKGETTEEGTNMCLTQVQRYVWKTKLEYCVTVIKNAALVSTSKAGTNQEPIRSHTTKLQYFMQAFGQRTAMIYGGVPTADPVPPLPKRECQHVLEAPGPYPPTRMVFWRAVDFPTHGNCHITPKSIL